MVFDLNGHVDMIERALNENCNYDTEHSEIDMGDDSDVHEMVNNLDSSGSQSARKTTENNNAVLE